MLEIEEHGVWAWHRRWGVRNFGSLPCICLGKGHGASWWDKVSTSLWQCRRDFEQSVMPEIGQTTGALKVPVFSGCKGNSKMGMKGWVNDPTSVPSGGQGRRGLLVLCRGPALAGALCVSVIQGPRTQTPMRCFFPARSSKF